MKKVFTQDLKTKSPAAKGRTPELSNKAKTEITGVLMFKTHHEMMAPSQKAGKGSLIEEAEQL